LISSRAGLLTEGEQNVVLMVIARSSEYMNMQAKCLGVSTGTTRKWRRRGVIDRQDHGSLPRGIALTIALRAAAQQDQGLYGVQEAGELLVTVALHVVANDNAVFACVGYSPNLSLYQ
jgi:hypothetical protein